MKSSEPKAAGDRVVASARKPAQLAELVDRYGDRVLPVGQAAAWKKLIPQAQVLRVPNTGHLVLDESPHAALAVGNFL